jgi:hypothetical protein
MSLSILEKNGKFVVTKNGEPINLPKTDGQSIVTEFTSKVDAETYINILNRLKKQKKYN